MFINRASIAAFAALALVLGTQGASKADGYASASGLLTLNGQKVSVNVSAYQFGSSVSGAIHITSNQFYFGSNVSTIHWSTITVASTPKHHIVVTSAPFTYFVWSSGVLKSCPAYAVITMTGSGAGATLGFEVVSGKDGSILVSTASETTLSMGGIGMYLW